MFGYEKGAFTGALQKKIGRFEMALRGTLFLDEVCDIPMELQPKLLRALQEKSIERVGRTQSTPIDIRLVAATNRNLRQMMVDRLFRDDLHYRLKAVRCQCRVLGIISSSANVPSGYPDLLDRSF